MKSQASHTESVATSRRQARATDDLIDASTRELARRRSGELHLPPADPAFDRVELCIFDLVTVVSVHLDVAPDRALDAFYHPYAYVTQPTALRRPASTRSTPGHGLRRITAVGGRRGNRHRQPSPCSRHSSTSPKGRQ